MQDSLKLVRFLAFATKWLAILLGAGIVIGALTLLSGVSPHHVNISHSDLLKVDVEEILSHPALFLALLVALLVAGCKLAIILQLHKILSTVLESSPFVMENAQRIRIIAFIFFTHIFLNMAQNALGSKLMREILQQGSGFSLKLDFTQIGIGLLILVLAEIFRLGVNMKEEQDLTI